jgi:hypothetical protein
VLEGVPQQASLRQAASDAELCRLRGRVHAGQHPTQDVLA